MAHRLIPLTPPLFFHFTLPLSVQCTVQYNAWSLAVNIRQGLEGLGCSVHCTMPSPSSTGKSYPHHSKNPGRVRWGAAVGWGAHEVSHMKRRYVRSDKTQLFVKDVLHPHVVCGYYVL